MYVYVCVTSSATTQQVICALLRKFNIIDNALKFALYERTFDDYRQQLGQHQYSAVYLLSCHY